MKSKDGMINLKELLGYFIKKWKIIVAIILVCTFTFIGIAWLFCDNVEIASSKEYDFYSGQAKKLHEYIDNSVLMNIDPTEIYEITLKINNISDKESVKNHVMSEEIWKNIVGELQTEYYAELVKWKELENNKEAEITFWHNNATECKEYAESLKKQIQMFDLQSKVIVGDVVTTSDEQLLIEQSGYWELLDSLEYYAKMATEAYTEKVTIQSAGIFGLLVGAIIAVSIVVAMLTKEKTVD